MRLYNREKIEAVLSPDTLVSAVKDAFIAFSNGHVTTPPVGYLPFKNPPGDMHIKYGHTKGDSIFVIKVATGFYIPCACAKGTDQRWHRWHRHSSAHATALPSAYDAT